MIPYEIDPSLHSGEPESAVLGDGFSPPQGQLAEAVESPPPSPIDDAAALPMNR